MRSIAQLALCVVLCFACAHGHSLAAKGPREIALKCVATGEFLRLAPKEHFEVRREGVCMGVPINTLMATIDRGEVPFLAPHTWWGFINNCYVKFQNPNVDACFSCIITDDGNMRCDSDLFGLKNNDRGWFTRLLDKVNDPKKAEKTNLELRDLMACPDPTNSYFKYGFTDKGKYKTEEERVVFKPDFAKAMITPTTMIDPQTQQRVPINTHQRVDALNAAWDQLDRYMSNVEQRGAHSHRNKVILRDIIAAVPRALRSATSAVLHHHTAGLSTAAARILVDATWDLRKRIVDKAIEALLIKGTDALAEKVVNAADDKALDWVISKVKEKILKRPDAEAIKEKCFNGFWSENFIHSAEAKANPKLASAEAQIINAVMEEPAVIQQFANQVDTALAQAELAAPPARPGAAPQQNSPNQGQLTPSTAPSTAQRQ